MIAAGIVAQISGVTIWRWLSPIMSPKAVIMSTISHPGPSLVLPGVADVLVGIIGVTESSRYATAGVLAGLKTKRAGAVAGAGTGCGAHLVIQAPDEPRNGQRLGRRHVRLEEDAMGGGRCPRRCSAMWTRRKDGAEEMAPPWIRTLGAAGCAGGIATAPATA